MGQGVMFIINFIVYIMKLFLQQKNGALSRNPTRKPRALHDFLIFFTWKKILIYCPVCI